MKIEDIQDKFIGLVKKLDFKGVNVKVKEDPKLTIAHVKFKLNKIRKNVLDCELLIGRDFKKYPVKEEKFLGHELGHLLFFRDNFYIATLVHLIGLPYRKSNYGMITVIPLVFYLIEEGCANLKAGQYGLKAPTAEDYLSFY